MMQDVILASLYTIKNIVVPFADEKVCTVYGRQLPHADASLIAAHARLFNYPAVSSVKSKDDIPQIGIKAAFLSDSFAAYRRSALEAVGGFPTNVIFVEDTFIAAKMLQAGWMIAYSSDAACYHSHNYSILEEFKRYFDIGIFHCQKNGLLNSQEKLKARGKIRLFRTEVSCELQSIAYPMLQISGK